MLCWSAAGTVRADEQALYQKTLLSTGYIEVPNLGGGTCWVLDREQKLVVTNKHVVGTKTDVAVVFPIFKDGEVVTDFAAYVAQAKKLAIKGKVLYRDEKRDLALVQLASLPDNVQALTLAKNSAVKGDSVLAIGNSSLAEKKLWKMRTGKVLAKGFLKIDYNNTGDHLEASMLVEQPGCNPGDSGGPVVNADGELVAVTSGTNLQTKVGFAIDITEVRTFLDRAQSKLPAPEAGSVVGTWTLTFQLGDGKTAVAGLTLRTDGTCLLETDKEMTGKYAYANGKLTLQLVGMGQETVSLTWDGDDGFAFVSGGISVLAVRR
jgi:S1-C subfamily serine protease